ncbi:MAG TPA: aminoacyl-tRNA hydrolase [Clostridiales bacterium]|nr:aminoacyl-tRNA hydrolase [Clostridiales bacterium]
MEGYHILAGLGNPGLKYRNTRHNVGFDTIDILSKQYGINIRQLKHKALIGDGFIEDKRVLLVKPQTYMNASGESIRDIVEWYKTPMESLILIYDDVDLPLGKIRIRRGGSAGTHNGMKSVIYHLQRDCFPRVRIGIDKAPEHMDIIKYVLSKFTKDERDVINHGVLKAAEAVVTVIKSGVDEAMTKFNG